MISLHVDLLLKPGAGLALEKTFHEVFLPAISLQPGFSRVALLASRSEADRFRLVIEFESEELRLKWVASDLHQRVWPKMETHFINYTLKGFTGVERPLDHAALWRSTSPLQPAIMGWFRD